ncbi:MAG: NAD(P)/FAD-dependent oxidoreductase [Myxococcota bacterium]
MTQKTEATPVDLLVLGAGNAGLGAAGVAREAGWTVRIVESRDVGGTCALRGCVPKKVLVAAAEALDVIRRAGSHHIDVGEVSLDWGALIARERTFVEGVPEQFEASLERRGIELVRGAARFVGPNEVEVDGVVHRAKKIVVATGSAPRVLPIEGFEHALTSDDLLQHTELPESIAFVGGGVIGLELGHVMARAGAKVTILEAAPRLLPRHDEDQVAELARVTESIGIDVHASVRVQRIEPLDGRFRVHFEKDGEAQTLVVHAVANAAGRAPNLDLNLEAAGISFDGRSLALDGFRSTENQNVFFAGDAVPGRPQLSPIASVEGRAVGRSLVSESLEDVHYDDVPSVVFTVPAIARVGLTEAEAKAAGLSFQAKVNDMRTWRSAKSYGEEAAWAKVLVEDETGRILGAHLVGHGGAETIHAFAAAITEGKTASDLKSRVYAYPTFHSDLKYLV